MGEHSDKVFFATGVKTCQHVYLQMFYQLTSQDESGNRQILVEEDMHPHIILSMDDDFVAGTLPKQTMVTVIILKESIILRVPTFTEPPVHMGPPSRWERVKVQRWISVRK